jgi:hypothetical protein
MGESKNKHLDLRERGIISDEDQAGFIDSLRQAATLAGTLMIHWRPGLPPLGCWAKCS